MKKFGFLEFIRDIGKHITVNYMMAKDSVKKRLSGESREGMSFTEFSYQLLQGYDFLNLYRTLGCKVQLGGSDQWGNMTTGTELIRRIEGAEDAWAITCPLITKADGGRYTSPYKFYQFWLNVSDDDAAKYIKIFTTLTQEEVEDLCRQQQENPGARPLQKRLAQEVTTMVHSAEDYEAAVEASKILFGNNTAEALHNLDEAMLLEVMEGVPSMEVSREQAVGAKLADILVDEAHFFASKGEMRKLAQGGGVSINKEKVADVYAPITDEMLLAGKYMLVQRGKKNYHLLIVR